MKRKFNQYSVWFGVGIALGVLLWTALFFCQLGMPTTLTKWSAESYVQKTAAAGRFAGKRILIYGGSSARFGISAEQMSRELGVPTVNLATHAALGLDYFLYRAREDARAGDVVLLPLEYPYYQTIDKFNASFVDYIISRDTAYFWQLPFIDKLTVIFSTSFSRLVIPFKEAIAPRPEPEYAMGIYNSVQLNAYGDSLENNRVFKTNEMRQVIDGFKPVEIYLAENSNSNELLKEFAKWCKEHGVSLIGAYPNTVYFEDYRLPGPREHLSKIRDFYLQIGAKFVGKPYDAMLDKSYFFDYGYHPDDLGAKIRTAKLVEDLRGVINPVTAADLRVTSAPTGKTNAVSQVISEFHGWEPLSGMFQFNGPYPEQGLPIIIYGRSDIVLKAISSEAEIHRLAITFRPQYDGQTVVISIDGKTVLSRTCASRNDFQKIELDLSLAQGPHEIRLQSDQGSAKVRDPNDISLLFKQLRLSTAPVTKQNQALEPAAGGPLDAFGQR